MTETTDTARKTLIQRRWIRPLPERLVNKIAAGEVIERPASVLKELVENAIDSGAKRIDVVVEKSGVTRIEVHDNGCGISSEQLEIAFSRHATSKISDFDDLEQISSYGFRGEALPSIASVSRLRMISKSADEDHATEIQIEGGVVCHVHPAHRADGSSVIVEDLFFNTPARKKFLKAESTEARHLIRTSGALALSSLGTAFSVTINGRKLYAFTAEDDLKTRAALILGSAPGALIEINAEHEGFVLRAVLGRPDVARSVRGGLHLFVNKRALRSSPLLSAFYLGYGELLPKGVFPIGAAMLEVDSRTVDVNVHPAKSEVRLSAEREAHSFIRQAVRDALRNEGIIPEFSLGKAAGAVDGQAPLPAPAAPAGPAGPNGGTASRADSVDIQYPAGGPHSVSATEQLFGGAQSSPGAAHDVPVVAADALELLPGGTLYLGQFNDLYLLAQKESDLYLIDQHAAHERILFEQIMAEMEKHAAISQRLLLPVNVELSPERFVVYESHKSELGEIGFEMSHLGGQTVMLGATPAILAHRSPEKVFSLALDDIIRLSKSGYTPLKAVAQSIACRSAVMDGDRLDPEEGKEIIRALFACDTGYTCPHGRPTFVKITRAELDRKFGRT